MHPFKAKLVIQEVCLQACPAHGYTPYWKTFMPPAAAAVLVAIDISLLNNRLEVNNHQQRAFQ